MPNEDLIMVVGDFNVNGSSQEDEVMHSVTQIFIG